MTKKEKYIIFAHAKQAIDSRKIFDGELKEKAMTESLAILSLMNALNISDEYYFDLTEAEKAEIRDQVWDELYH